MKNLLLSIFVFFTSFYVSSQCYTAPYGQWPTTSYTPTCNSSCLFETITSAGYAGEYSLVNVTSGNTYTFRSSITTDRITVDDNGAAPLVGVTGTSGTGGITWTATFTGTVRFYTHTTAACGSSTTIRTRSVCRTGCGGGGGGGCVNTFQFGSAVAPTTPTTVTISTCNFQGDYSVVSGISSGQTYQFGYSYGGYITVRSGTYNGPVVASGNAPLNWASSYTGTVYVHYNTNSSCGTASLCGTSTVSCLTCSAPSAPANDLVCNAYAISCGQLLSATTVNATNSGTGENNACGVSQTMPGVWFQVAGTGQVMTAYLCNTAWDSKISVFSGPNCSSLTCVGGNDDNGPSCLSTSASYQWTSVPGLTYYILVHGYSTNSAFQIGLLCSAPPPADPTSVSASSWSICNGGSTTLTANGAVGTVYWYTGGCGTSQIGTGNSITVSPTTTTTYYARNWNGSQFSTNCVSATVTVNYPPTLTTSASSNTICAGSSTQLNVSTQASGSLTTTFAGGNGCYGGNMFDLTTGGNQVTVTGFTLNPTTTSVQSVNVYYRVGSYAGNELNPGAWTLLGTYTLNGVAATPTYMAVGSLIIPPGSTYGIYVQYDAIYTTASSSYSNGTLTLNAGVGLCGAFSGANSPRTFNGIVHYNTGSNATYMWSPSASLNNSSISNPIATPSSTTTYTVTATSNGCSSSSSRTITVNPLPSVSAGPNQTICSGSGVSLNGSGASTYAWNNGVTNGVAFTPASTQTYTVTGTAANGCTGTAQTTVTVNAAPILSINASTNTVCGGTPVTLTASGANSYSWNNGISNGVAFTPNTTQTYTVTGTAANGCTGTAQTTVNVNAAPTLSISASANTVCAGTAVTLTGSGANSYSWNNGVTNGVTFYPNGTQTYTVTGTNSNGCSNTASTTVTVLSNPVANAGSSQTGSLTCGLNQVTLGANTPSAGQTGTWTVFSGSGGSFSNPNSPTSTFTGNYGQAYTLQWTVSNGQCSTSYQKLVTFNQPNDASLAGAIGTNDLLWGGLTSTDWATSTNWYEKQPAGHYIRLSGAAQPNSNTQVFTLSQANGGLCIGNVTPTLSVNGNAYDVFINPGVTLDLSNDSLNITHDLVNSGTLTASIGTVNFIGNTNSTVSGNGSTQLFNMRVNKSGGATLTLGQPVVVNNILTMIQGNVFTTLNNLLTLGVSSSQPGTLNYNTGTIVGPFRRYFSSQATNGLAGLFPVGTSNFNRYTQINFTSSPGTNQTLTVQYKTGAPLVNNQPLYNGLPLTISNSLIQNYSADGYWEVIPTGSNYNATINSTPYNVTLFANNLNGMTTPQICRIIKSPGSSHTSWQSCGTHVTIPQNANPQSFLISSNNTQGFSWFNIGTPNSQALPVQLFSFTTNCETEATKIEWKTATEHNSDYFEIQKSTDGVIWQSIAKIESALNSTSELTYNFIDKESGDNYYKLLQYDIDGNYSEWGPILAKCGKSSSAYLSAFPNPSTGKFSVVVNDKSLLGDAKIVIKDSKGSLVNIVSVKITSGINLFVIDEKLMPGLYFVNIESESKTSEVLREIIR